MQSDDVYIPEPCGERWEDMEGTDAARRKCLRCKHEVVNLSSMTERRAKRVLAQGGPDLCVTYRVGVTGEIAFQSPTQHAKRSLVAGVALALAACDTEASKGVVAPHLEQVSGAPMAQVVASSGLSDKVPPTSSAVPLGSAVPPGSAGSTEPACEASANAAQAVVKGVTAPAPRQPQPRMMAGKPMMPKTPEAEVSREKKKSDPF